MKKDNNTASGFSLHLNGKSPITLESQAIQVDREKDRAYQQKFSGDDFYASLHGIHSMWTADQETRKFNDLTLDDRLAPEVNHDRVSLNPNLAPMPPL